jgi:hypothetical protein
MMCGSLVLSAVLPTAGWAWHHRSPSAGQSIASMMALASAVGANTTTAHHCSNGL